MLASDRPNAMRDWGVVLVSRASSPTGFREVGASSPIITHPRAGPPWFPSPSLDPMDARVLSIRQVRDLWTAQSSRSGDAQERPAEDPPSSGLLAPEQPAFIGVPRVEMSA